MRTPPAVLVRVVAFAALGLTVLAVVIGRYDPSRPEVRRPAPARYRPGPNVALCDAAPAPGLCLLDAESGDLVRVPLAGSERILFAACSPWQDSLGRTHVVGLWKELHGVDVRRTGLARCAVPGAEVLDRVELDVLPGSTPCWPPGLGTWVIYAGTDGTLYRLAFEEGATAPRPLGWRCPRPWGGRLMIVDAVWPSDPRLAATIVVGLRRMPPEEGGPPAWVETQLWWLKLDPDGTAIEGAGPLIGAAPGRPHEELAVERLPAVSTTPGGGLALAYLARRRDESAYRLRLAPMTIDATTGAPRVDGSAVVEVAHDRAPGPAAFSNDGRWLHAFPNRSPSPTRAERFSVVEALARSGCPAADPAGRNTLATAGPPRSNRRRGWSG